MRSFLLLATALTFTISHAALAGTVLKGSDMPMPVNEPAEPVAAPSEPVEAPSKPVSHRHKFAAHKDKPIAQEAPVSYNDPWENFNHPIFSFNLAFDRNIAKPLISGYDVIPLDQRHNVSNFLSNLSEPLNAVHGVLQGDPKIFFTSMWRFILNSTFGLGGIRDFAREQGGLRNMEQDLGKTMGHWGVGAGPYIVLPILGPSSARDTTGKIGDWFIDPVGWELTTPEIIGQVVADGIDTRDSEAGVIQHLYYESLDPYVATRSAYRQHEKYKETHE